MHQNFFVSYKKQTFFSETSNFFFRRSQTFFSEKKQAPQRSNDRPLIIIYRHLYSATYPICPIVQER